MSGRRPKSPVPDRGDRGPNRRIPPWLVYAAAAVAMTGLIAFWIAGRHSIDFLSFYGAGTAVLEGRTADLYDRHYLMELQERWKSADHAGGFYPYYYPPIFALTYVPLAALPMVPARVVWGIASVGLVLWALQLSRRWSGLGFAGSLALLLVVGPLYIALVQLHMSAVLLVVIAAEALWLWRSRDREGTGMLAGVLLVKPQLLLPLLAFWLWRMRWRTLSGFVAAAVLVATASVVLSPEASTAYLASRSESLGAGLRSLEVETVNLALYSGLNVLLGERAALGTSAFLSLVVIVTLLAAWGRRGPGGPYHHAMLWLAPLLVTPYLGAYDLLLVYVPLSFLVRPLREDRVLLWAVIATLLLQGSLLPVKSAHVRLVPWSVLALYAVCAWRALRHRAGRACASRPRREECGDAEAP